MMLSFCNILFLFSICTFASVALTESAIKDPCQPKPNTYYAITSSPDQQLGAVAPDYKSVSVTPGPVNDEKTWYFKQQRQNTTLIYSIRNKQNNLALGIPKGSENGSASYELSKYEKKSEQHFYLIPSGDGCKIIAVIDKTLLANQKDEATAQEEAKIITYPRMQLTSAKGNEKKKEKFNETWKFEEQICDPFPNQTYHIVHVLSKKPMSAGGPDQVYRNGNPKMVLLSSDEIPEFALFEFALIDNSKTVYQIYGENILNIANVAGSEITKGSAIIDSPSHSSVNTHFSLHISSDGNACMIKGVQSQRFLAPLKRKGAYKSGSEIVLNEEEETKDELWRFEASGWIPDTEIAYRIKNRATEKYLDVGNTLKNTYITLNIIHKESQQQLFYFEHALTEPGWFSIRSKFSNFSLDAMIDQSRPIIQYDNEYRTWQKFKFDEVEKADGKSYFTMMAQNKQPKFFIPKEDNYIYAEPVKEDDPKAQWELIPE